MRNLLVIALLAFASVVAGLWQPPTSEAASLTVVSYLYHPTGQTTAAYLSCGWHDNCDGVVPDSPGVGLDWRPCGLTPTSQPCPYDQNTWVRFRSATLTGSGYVAQAQSFNWTRGGCPGIDTRLYRWSNTSLNIGTARNNHSTHTGSTGYLNLYATPSGYNSSAGVGVFLDPGPDPCSSYWHTMQWYISGPYDNTYYKNTSRFPGENTCHQTSCARYYGTWTYEEYSFSFNS
jgi:hypothetical protein